MKKVKGTVVLELTTSPIGLGTVSVLFTLVPILFLLTSPFLKLSIVFGVLRTGFSAQGIPGSAAIGALALVLSLHISGPMLEEIISQSGKNTVPPKGEISDLFEKVKNACLPLEDFLEKHIGSKEKEYFDKRSIGNKSRLFKLIPAFVLSELRTGCEMALYLFIPFFVVDMLVTTILTAMGMVMVNPVTIAFPLKLFLFVSCDGWLQLTKSLVESY